MRTADDPFLLWWEEQVRKHCSGEEVDPLIKKIVNRAIWERYAFGR